MVASCIINYCRWLILKRKFGPSWRNDAWSVIKHHSSKMDEGRNPRLDCAWTERGISWREVMRALSLLWITPVRVHFINESYFLQRMMTSCHPKGTLLLLVNKNSFGSGLRRESTLASGWERRMESVSP